MTQNIFSDALIIFLIAYAIIDIFYEISNFFLNKYSKVSPKDYIVLPLYHGDEHLECLVRFAIQKSEVLRCTLVILPHNLDNCEESILRHLIDECKNVTVRSPEEFAESIKLKDCSAA